MRDMLSLTTLKIDAKKGKFLHLDSFCHGSSSAMDAFFVVQPHTLIALVHQGLSKNMLRLNH
jgi:hypothetical protein